MVHADWNWELKSGGTTERNKDLPWENLETSRIVQHMWWTRIVTVGQGQKDTQVSFSLLLYC